jgi:hypothetical protein
MELLRFFTNKYNNITNINNSTNINENNDSGLYNRTVKYIDVNGIQKKKKVLLYSSGEEGTNIRNALTGIYYPNYKVGTIDEYLLFKVLLTKENKQILFFFDSPTEYEESQNIIVSDNKKNEWYERKVKIFYCLYP